MKSHIGFASLGAIFKIQFQALKIGRISSMYLNKIVRKFLRIGNGNLLKWSEEFIICEI